MTCFAVPVVLIPWTAARVQQMSLTIHKLQVQLLLTWLPTPRLTMVTEVSIRLQVLKMSLAQAPTISSPAMVVSTV